MRTLEGKWAKSYKDKASVFVKYLRNVFKHYILLGTT